MTYKAEEIQSLLNLFERSSWNELRLETAGLRIAVSKTGPLSTNVASTSRSGSVEAPSPAPTPGARAAAAAGPVAAGETTPAAKVADALGSRQTYLRAPNLGVFWSKPKPDAPPFVVEGQVIAAGETVCVIEVMKLFTQVVATEGGRVARCLVTDGTMVEHDTPLFVIEPA